jgi:hypothetical protein
VGWESSPSGASHIVLAGRATHVLYRAGTSGIQRTITVIPGGSLSWTPPAHFDCSSRPKLHGMQEVFLHHPPLKAFVGERDDLVRWFREKGICGLQFEFVSHLPVQLLQRSYSTSWLAAQVNSVLGLFQTAYACRRE